VLDSTGLGDSSEAIFSMIHSEREILDLWTEIQRLRMVVPEGVAGVRAAGEREREEMRRIITDLSARKEMMSKDKGD